MPEHDSTPPDIDPSASSGPSTGSATGSSGTGGSWARGSGFFGWLRGLGIVRDDAWIGGVCGGVAARLGIDPIVVRGVAVVVAILGGPAFLFYAAAWALLPDRDGRIHLERLIRGTFDPATIGIIVLALLAFLPITQGVWWAGSQFWGGPAWPQALGRVLWTIVLIGAIVAFLIWVGRRSTHPSWGGGFQSNSRTASANDAAAPGTAPFTATPANAEASPGTTGTTAAATAAANATAANATVADDPASNAAPVAPATPPAGASSDDLEAWKRQQAAWKREHDDWKFQQAAGQRAIRAQHSAEIRAQARLLAAEATAEQRLRRLANPRTSGAYVAIALGATLIAGAITASVAGTIPQWQGYEATMGLAAATATVGLAMIVAGIIRRRSGFLAFIAILLAIGTLSTALIPRDRDFILFSGSQPAASSARIFQPLGSYMVDLGSADRRSGSDAPEVIDVQQWAGSVQVFAQDGVTVRVETEKPANQSYLSGVTVLSNTDGTVASQHAAARRLADGSSGGVLDYGTAAQPDVIIRVTQGAGSVWVQYQESADDSSTSTTGTNK